MKAFRIPFLLLLLCATLLCACSRQKLAFHEADAPHHFKELKTIEILLETQPEAALDSINALRIRDEQKPFSELDDNELRLREVQAHYKNRCLTPNSPDLAPVVAFYDSLATLFPDDADLQFLRANAYYYKGVECAFANEDVEAFTHYLKALEVMRQRETWEDHPYANRFIALTYTRLSEILYRYGIREAAIETCHKAASYYESEADLAAMLRFEAAIYQSQKDYDKAMTLFEKAEQQMPVGDEPMQLAVGAKLFELQQYDSAVPHLARAFASGDRFARVDAAAKLAEIFRDKGMADQELAYTRYYVENSLMETRLTSHKMEIEYLFDAFSNPKTETFPTKSNNYGSLLMLSLFLLLVIAFMAYIIYRNRRRISHIENKITDIEQKHEQENADKDLELEQMAQQLSAPHIDFDEAWKSFSESAIVKKIVQSVEGKDIMIKSVGVYPKLKLKEMDYIELVREANGCFPDFSSRFLKDYPDLNVADLRHSCLALLGLNDAEIAVLEGISYSGTNRRTNKILAVLGQGNNLEQALLYYLKKSY